MKGKVNTSNNYNKEDVYKNLDNIISWINNSEVKASIALGLFGVIITVLFTNDSLIKKYADLFKEVIKNVNFSDVLYILFIILSIGTIFLGLYKLIKVLIPTLQTKFNLKKPSHIYFGSIANFNSSLEFKESLNDTTEEELMDDLLNQVYINSIICMNKFNNFQIGLKFSLSGFLLLIFLIIIGIIVYL